MNRPVSLWSFVTVILLICQPQSSVSYRERKIDPEIQKKIDDFVKDVFLPQAHVQGLGLAIMQNDGEVLYTTGYGFSNIQDGIPNGNETQFGLGSASKSVEGQRRDLFCLKGVTALVVVKVLHEHFPEMGEAVLDTPVVKLAPELNITFIDRFRTEQITIRDLLAQRHCLDYDWFPIAAESISTRTEVVYRQRYQKQLCSFRSNVTYSNSLIAMAGEVAAYVAGKPFEELAQDIFLALGMNKTEYVKYTDSFSELPERAQPYYVINDQAYPFNQELIKRIIPVNPSGGLFTTPNDVMKYLSLILQRGELDGRQIIPKEVIDWLMKPSNLWELPQYKGQEGDKAFTEFAYGLGWVISAYDGWELLQHGGGFDPYSAMVSVFPAKNLTVFMAIHEGPERLRRITIPLFVFETLNRNPKAKEIAMGIMNDHENENEREKKSYQSRKDSEHILRMLKKNPMSTNALIPGSYGSGPHGDLLLTERFNSDLNETGYYVQYGKWYKGWIKEDPRFPGILFILELDTDIWHDFHSFGYPDAVAHLLSMPEAEIPTVSLLVSSDANLSEIVLYAEFVHGAGLDTLPVIPWEPGSCGSNVE